MSEKQTTLPSRPFLCTECEDNPAIIGDLCQACFAALQEPLGREFEEVLSKNLEALYVRS